MATVLQINCALWIMIGCATVEIVQFVRYLSYANNHFPASTAAQPSADTQPTVAMAIAAR
jgi:hypothetical protein